MSLSFTFWACVVAAAAIVIHEGLKGAAPKYRGPASDALGRLRGLYEDADADHVRPLWVTCVDCRRESVHERYGLCLDCYEAWLGDYPDYAEVERLHPTPWQLERMVYGVPEDVAR